MILIIALSMIAIGILFLYETATLRLILLKHSERVGERANALEKTARLKNRDCHELLAQMAKIKDDVEKEEHFYQLADRLDEMDRDVGRLLIKGNRLETYNHLLLDLVNSGCYFGSHKRIQRLVMRHCYEEDGYREEESG
jgi:uncharacterized protein YoxC